MIQERLHNLEIMSTEENVSPIVVNDTVKEFTVNDTVKPVRGRFAVQLKLSLIHI